jgi:hypothetical protein
MKPVAKPGKPVTVTITKYANGAVHKSGPKVRQTTVKVAKKSK